MKIFEHFHAANLLEVIEKDQDSLEDLVHQLLKLNIALDNWSYVLRAFELKVKLAGKEKGEWDYKKILNYLELVC